MTNRRSLKARIMSIAVGMPVETDPRPRKSYQILYAHSETQDEAGRFDAELLVLRCHINHPPILRTLASSLPSSTKFGVELSITPT